MGKTVTLKSMLYFLLFLRAATTPTAAAFPPPCRCSQPDAPCRCCWLLPTAGIWSRRAAAALGAAPTVAWYWRLVTRSTSGLGWPTRAPFTPSKDEERNLRFLGGSITGAGACWLRSSSLAPLPLPLALQTPPPLPPAAEVGGGEGEGRGACLAPY